MNPYKPPSNLPTDCRKTFPEICIDNLYIISCVVTGNYIFWWIDALLFSLGIDTGI